MRSVIMRGNRLAAGGALLAALALPACKPPPTDAAVARVDIAASAAGPAAPLPSPDTTDAIWAHSSTKSGEPLRLVYGVPGQPVLLAIECLGPATPSARVQITRYAPADEGAGALLALIGNGAIARVEVDATAVAGQRVWQGEAPALTPGWNALKPGREATATIPGAGLLKLNPSPLPFLLVEACREPALPEPQADRL